ncbi:hypothetical protein [Aeoliella mucimassa]|nr:hypothetical protein [Aeoliella mucimassa]
MNRSLLLLFAELLVALTICGNPCVAGLSWSQEWSWSTVSENDQYILVSLLPSSVEEQIEFINNSSWEDEAERMATVAEMRRLEATYSVSGVYRNDGSTTPLWTLSQFVSLAKVSPDGNRVIQVSAYSDIGCPTIYIHDATGCVGSISDFSVAALPALACDRILGNQGLYIDDWAIDPNDPSWTYMTISWADGAESTVRLDDLSVVRSNTTRYAMLSVLSNPKGIAALIVFLAMVCFLVWGCLHLVMRSKHRRDA